MDDDQIILDLAQDASRRSMQRLVRRIRPSRVEQGVLLAARWLIEYGQPSVAANMLRDHGLDGCDIRKMEEQDIEILARLNITDGTHFILPNVERTHRQ
jgi:hypothetical protein